MSKEHQKHAMLARPSLGAWGRNELGLFGASCSLIQAFTATVADELQPQWKLAFVDADRAVENVASALDGAIHFTDKIRFKRIDFSGKLTSFQQHALLNDADLVFINGNHFKVAQQIIFITPEKPLEAKLEQLSSIKLVLLKDGNTTIPDYLKPQIGQAPILVMNEMEPIISFFRAYLRQRLPALHGLVLTGGKSLRMGTDKGLLNYHGKPQRDHVYEMLLPLCKEVFVSCNAAQSGSIAAPKIEDRFIDIGPMGGLLSALQSAPDVAWLTVACDMPYLSRKTLDHLIAHRDPSKMATAFMNEDKQFPEPLITIWEPRAYPILLQALSKGISCPRKVLIHSDARILHAPYSHELHNVNDPASFNQALISTKAPAPKKPR